ncbi:MAG: TIGR00266 family protein [Rhodospirillaceae bacterium]
MEHQITHGPSFALLQIGLEHGEEIRCESGAMVAMSADLDLSAKMNAPEDSGFFGRAFGAAKRAALGGESFFITTIAAKSGPGQVDLAPATPGDIYPWEMIGIPLLVQGGSYLASGPDVAIDVNWGGLKSLMGGEGLFFLRAEGRGALFLASFGGISRRDLAPGEKWVVDSGHLVAFEEGIAMETRLATGTGSGGFFSRAVTSATTGEGLVMEFTGPGTVLMQTRNPEAFSGWIKTLIPEITNNSSGQ